MRIFYDTEFLEDGETIGLISIGIVTESGAVYYAINSDAPWERIQKNKWLCENVVKHLPLATGLHRHDSGVRDYYFSVATSDSRVKPKWVIANEVRDFITRYQDVELWADYAAYDHVALAQLWGSMIRLPKGIPMWTHDFQQYREQCDPSIELPAQVDDEHNALGDALHLARCYDHLARAGQNGEPE